MKILDRYVTKNFFVGYLIALAVLLGLRIVTDLFVNLDEFAEHASIGAMGVFKNIVTYYSMQATVYFRDFAGLITVIAAVFSLGKMTRNNELVAVMASGVSLKRLIMPIVICSVLLTGVLVVDQEFVIPRLADKLSLDTDEIGAEAWDKFWFLPDSKGSLISSPYFDILTETMYNPTIITRNRKNASTPWRVTGRITADRATYNHDGGRWMLENGRFLATPLVNGTKVTFEPMRDIDSYPSEITIKDIVVRRKSDFLSYMSWRDLSIMASQKTKIRDVAQLLSEKHFRVTEPVIDLIMLMIALPVLVCRDPKTLKSAIGTSFLLTAGCYLLTFVCKMAAPEQTYIGLHPELWAWLPIFVFLPIALIQLDSMKT
jgi:lipopolysaccharide export system permease protein